MLSILQRMYDLTPNNPVTIIEQVIVTCTSIDDIVPIGGEYLRHAFIVLQDADITVKDSGGATLKRGTDYFTISRATDQAYSKQYSTSIYSGLKFKATGTYTVTSFISCGTYPRAGWFNYLLEQFLTLRDVTVVALSSAVSTLRSDLNNMISTVQSTAASLSSLLSEYSNHAADTDIHITAAERAAWNGKTNTYFVATIAERDALTGLKVGDRVVVWNDGDSKRAVYFYAGSSTWYKDSDPDWENISLAWSALSGIPANVSAVVSAAGVTATATAGAVAMWDASGKLKSVSPTDADANQTVATVEYVKAKVTATGGGNVSTSDTSSSDGEIVVTDGTTGKLHKKSGTLLSTILGYFTDGAAFNAMTLENFRDIPATQDPLFQVSSDYVLGAGMRLYIMRKGHVNSPSAAQDCRVIVFGDGNCCDAMAYGLDDKSTWRRSARSGTWEGTWTQLTDGSGNAMGEYLGDAVLQSGPLSNNTSVSAQYDGWVVFEILVTSGATYVGYAILQSGATSGHFVGRVAPNLTTFSNILAFRIKAGQKLSAVSNGWSSGSYKIIAAV